MDLIGIVICRFILGWIYFIYFFSIGYGFAISALSLASVIIFRDVITSLSPFWLPYSSSTASV